MNESFNDKAYNAVVSSLRYHYKIYSESDGNKNRTLTVEFAKWLINNDPTLSEILLSSIIEDHMKKGELK